MILNKDQSNFPDDAHYSRDFTRYSHDDLFATQKLFSDRGFGSGSDSD